MEEKYTLALTLLLVVVLGVGAVSAFGGFDEEVEATNTVSPATCGANCGNSCTAERNCGQETCGAINGGSCGCSRGN
jgi:hypothetical protein